MVSGTGNDVYEHLTVVDELTDRSLARAERGQKRKVRVTDFSLTKCGEVVLVERESCGASRMPCTTHRNKPIAGKGVIYESWQRRRWSKQATGAHAALELLFGSKWGYG